MNNTVIAMQIEEVLVVNNSDLNIFKVKVDKLLKNGWVLLSTNVGFLNSADFNFMDWHQAILGRPKNVLKEDFEEN